MQKASASDIDLTPATPTTSNHVLVPNKHAGCPSCQEKVKELGRKKAKKNRKETSTKCKQCRVPMC